jgi:hypothetical protein
MTQAFSDLNDLSLHIRHSLPDAKAILNLKVLQQLGVVTFYWHGVEFLVRPSLQVLELRGKNVYITGLSTLLQLILARKTQQEKMVDSVIARINQVEDIIQSNKETESAVRVLGSAKETLNRMVGR